MIRKIIGVIAGYLIFAVSAVMLFNITGQKPHADATLGFKIATAIYGIVFSKLGGWVCGLISASKNLAPNYILAIIIAAFALASMLTAGGNSWTQLQANTLFAPASFLGGWLNFRNKSSSAV